MKSHFGKCKNEIISSTHKRAKGCAPVWGSEFTLKDGTLQGGSSRNRCLAKSMITEFGDCAVVVVRYPLLSPTLFSNLFEESIQNLHVARAPLSCGGAMRAIAPSMPPHACPQQGSRRPTPRSCAAGASSINMCQWWSARSNAMASNSNSP
jgi:hypothetical protein